MYKKKNDARANVLLFRSLKFFFFDVALLAENSLHSLRSGSSVSKVRESYSFLVCLFSFVVLKVR